MVGGWLLEAIVSPRLLEGIIEETVSRLMSMMMKRLLTILCIPAVLLLLGGPSEGYAFDELSLKKLLAMNRCAKCDLSGANLKKANLYKANLEGANLRGANLYKANLSKADLREANLSKAYLILANLKEANLSGADLSGANLKWANLFKTNLTDVDLTNTELGKTKLTSAILCRTKVAWGVENRDCK